MNFVYPAFLFALSAIVIPILIHLFNFRKFTTVYFSNVRFLKEVKEETQAKSKLKHLFVLIARILAITFLVFAFAQPFVPGKNKKAAAGNKVVSVFIDNSFSMELINKNGSLLDEGIKRAKEIAKAYKPTDRFQLLTNDFEGKHQRLVNQEEFIQQCEEVKISAASRPLSEIFSRQSDVLNSETKKTKVDYILSDFQKSNYNPTTIKNDTSITVNFVPLVSAQKSNVYIDSLWFETPVRQFNKQEKLHVLIKNNSDNAVENNSIKLFINGLQKTPASFNVDKQSKAEIILAFVSKEVGLQQCKVEISDYPITFDDSFFFSFEVSKNVPVLVINTSEMPNGSPFLNKLFGNDSTFVLKNETEKQLNYSTLSNHKLIVLNELSSIPSGLAEELKRFMDKGGSVMALPAKKIEIELYNSFFTLCNSANFQSLDTSTTKVDKINMESDIYKDVFDKKTFTATNLDLPKVNVHYTFLNSTKNTQEYLLKLQNGDVFLSHNNVGKGNLYIASSGINSDFGNFAKHAIFVPTLFKIGINSQNNEPLCYTIGKDEKIEITQNLTGESVFKMKSAQSDFEIIPEYRMIDNQSVIYTHNQITTAGNYYLTLSDNDSFKKAVSFNYNRNESTTDCYTPEALNELIQNKNIENFNVVETSAKNLTATLTEAEQGKSLWKICLVLVLLFFALEVILLRFL